MSSKTILRLLALLLAVFSLSVPLFAQQDDAPSVAEAARRARQQKQEAAKPPHVIDNDAIAPSPAASAATPALAAPASDANSAKPSETGAASGGAPKSEADKAEEEKKKADIEALKQQIADKLAKVNLQQREIALTQDTYISNPDHEHDKTGKEKLDSMQLDLTQLQAELTELQAKLAAVAPPSDEKTPESPKP
jgi:chromosome segregation ATPase